MEIKELKEKLGNDLLNLGYKLYDCYFEKKEHILHVVIDAKMDMNQIEELSKKVSQIMDLYDGDMDEYMLDVSTVGIEKEIRNLDELKDAIGSYIYVKTKELKVYGDLESLEGNILTLKTKDKNITKTIKVDYSNVKYVRYAVKF